MDRESRSNRYYRNAVERHWDPADIDLETDRENLISFAETHDWFDEQTYHDLLGGVALFGAGEDAVTEDLAPLATVVEDLDDQLFLTTQLYEEAKHADFFDRYWREVAWAVEDELGWEQTNPRSDYWFGPNFLELFDRNRAAQYRLLEEDTPENRAKAYTHYHLTVEGIFGQTGYYGMQTSYGGKFDDLPHLPGLVEGFDNIRSDEGRHVGFGMSQLKKLVASGAVDMAVIDETVNELMELLIVDDDEPSELDDRGLEDDELVSYAWRKHSERMNQIAEASEDIPDVDELVALE
ncbi:MAG: ribonucleoside-diphosphate reductase [Natrialbaceae archaeon]|nr:ribonucleoside-diphosphate reductase [Natrialbaceae archaeon]